DGVAKVIASLTDQLNRALGHGGVQWSLETRSGEPAHVLTTVAHELGASMIVVGTRAPGLTPRLEEWLRGSVAVHLSRRQEQPVIVVPLHASGPAAGYEGLNG
ncbi:MAG: universal stress protein, partial [Acidobacteria bacterium]|nr:universal stress protein [Acidobacteriota bacterium]